MNKQDSPPHIFKFIHESGNYQNKEFDRSITVIIRIVNKLTDTALRSINLLAGHVDEVVLLFSGNKNALITVKQQFSNFNKVKVWWVYNLGFPEPIWKAILDHIKNPWMIILTDRDVLSDGFLNWTDDFPIKDVDGYLCVRRFGSLDYKNLPEWLVRYIKDSKASYQAYLYRKEKVHISGIIHTPYKVQGNLVYLNPENYYVIRTYSPEDLNNPRKFVEHWIEKERRYIFIELFTRRMTRLSALNKILEGIPILRNHEIALPQGPFFSKELTHFEYIIFEWIRSLSMKRIGLDVYQKIKINTLKNMKDHNTLELKLSELFRQLDGDIVNYLGMKSIFVDESDNDFVELIDPKEAEVSFIRILLKNLIRSSPEKNIDVDSMMARINSYIDEVRKELDINVRKYMPLNI